MRILKRAHKEFLYIKKKQCFSHVSPTWSNNGTANFLRVTVTFQEKSDVMSSVQGMEADCRGPSHWSTSLAKKNILEGVSESPLHVNSLKLSEEEKE